MFQTDYSGCRQQKHNKSCESSKYTLKGSLSLAQTEAESVVCKMTVICLPPPFPPLLGTRFSVWATIIPGLSSKSQCLCHFLCNCGHWRRKYLSQPSRVNVFSITLLLNDCFIPHFRLASVLESLPAGQWPPSSLSAHIFYFHDNCHWPAPSQPPRLLSTGNCCPRPWQSKMRLSGGSSQSQLSVWPH